MSNPLDTVSSPPLSAFSAYSADNSIWSDIGRVAGKVVAAPFRTASSLVNAGVFGAYYVTTVAVSGLALVGSSLTAPVRMVVDFVFRRNQDKPLSDYVVSPVKKMFKFMSRLYNELPERGSELIFAGVGIVALPAKAIVAAARDHREGGNRRGGDSFVYVDARTTVNNHHENYEGRRDDTDDDSYFWRMLRPYKISTDIGAAIMDKTTRVVNGLRVPLS